MRIDKFLVQNGYFESRNRAVEAIKSGRVFIDNRVAKPSTKCNFNSKIEIKESKFYISRASRKLELFLEEYPLDINNRNVLDIGSSTGGFVQILLEHGAKSVVAVDVGVNQLHYTLRDNPKVELFEQTDIRDFNHKAFDLVTCDVSFISILQIISHIDRLSSRDIIILFKPQFEVGRKVKRNSKGVVVDKLAIKRVQNNFLEKTKELNWHLIASSISKVIGKFGNIEYIYHFRKDNGL